MSRFWEVCEFIGMFSPLGIIFAAWFIRGGIQARNAHIEESWKGKADESSADQ